MPAHASMAVILGLIAQTPWGFSTVLHVLHGFPENPLPETWDEVIFI